MCTVSVTALDDEVKKKNLFGQNEMIINLNLVYLG